MVIPSEIWELVFHISRFYLKENFPYRMWKISGTDLYFITIAINIILLYLPLDLSKSTDE